MLKPKFKGLEFGRIGLKPHPKNLQINLTISKLGSKVVFKKNKIAQH